MKQIFKLLLILPLLVFAEGESKISPDGYIVGAPKDGKLYVGLLVKSDLKDTIKIADGNETIDRVIVKPIQFNFSYGFTFPLSDKDKNQVRINEKLIMPDMASKFKLRITEDAKFLKKRHLGIEAKLSLNEFKYHPTGKSDVSKETEEVSYSYAFQYYNYFAMTVKDRKVRLYPQFQVKYNREWKAGDKVGVVNEANSDGITTVTELVLTAPKEKETLNLDFALNLYSKSDFSVTPAVFLERNKTDEVNNAEVQAWLFYYPKIKKVTNVKLGLSPYVKIKGNSDDHEWGGIFSVQFSKTFLDFL